jgi:hypothetical protein
VRKMSKAWLAGGAFAAAFLTAAVTFARWKAATRKGIANVPSMEPTFPFGNVGFLAKHGVLKAFQALTDKFGPVSAMWFFDAQWVVVHRAEDVKTVFASSVYRKPHPVQEIHNHALAGRKVCASVPHASARFPSGFILFTGIYVAVCLVPHAR